MELRLRYSLLIITLISIYRYSAYYSSIQLFIRSIFSSIINAGRTLIHEIGHYMDDLFKELPIWPTLFYFVFSFFIVHYLLNPLGIVILEISRALLYNLGDSISKRLFPNGLPKIFSRMSALFQSSEFEWEKQIVVITGGRIH